MNSVYDILRYMSDEEVDAGISKEGPVPVSVDPDRLFATRLAMANEGKPYVLSI